ncbi:MAG: tetratricopeptide repeat protein [Pirellulales bacterium]|nr:tetratricopeptide repeat protein [Pirellulales bacterium]
MKISHIAAGLAVGLVLVCGSLARAETAEEAFAQGTALLGQGKFREAVQAYGEASQADRKNQEYMQRFLLVRRIITMRDKLDGEKNPARWNKMAQALHAFYSSEGLHDDAVGVAEKIHARLNTAFSASQLAETHLLRGDSAKAIEVLSALPPKETTPAAQALLGIALAREGRTDEALQVSRVVADAKSNDPGTLYGLARMHAAVGNPDEALRLLTRTFESVPPSRLDTLKSHAKTSPEFRDLASSDKFASVLRTKSKVAESKCSGGSSCAGCPMRGKCPKSGGA